MISEHSLQPQYTLLYQHGRQVLAAGHRRPILRPLHSPNRACQYPATQKKFLRSLRRLSLCPDTELPWYSGNSHSQHNEHIGDANLQLPQAFLPIPRPHHPTFPPAHTTPTNTASRSPSARTLRFPITLCSSATTSINPSETVSHLASMSLLAS